MWSFHVDVLPKSTKKCTKVNKAGAEPQIQCFTKVLVAADDVAASQVDLKNLIYHIFQLNLAT